MHCKSKMKRLLQHKLKKIKKKLLTQFQLFKNGRLRSNSVTFFFLPNEQHSEKKQEFPSTILIKVFHLKINIPVL